MKPWIEFNNDKRKESKSAFEKDMFKLMNNAVYGKTMENVRNHIDFELVSTQERLQKCVNNLSWSIWEDTQPFGLPLKGRLRRIWFDPSQRQLCSWSCGKMVQR